VLDAEQNSTFRDNFLELPFDLSDVMFITTANTTDTIPRPLLDRMEVIELPSYTDEEKLQIAKRYLLPKEMKRHGLEKAQLKVSDGAIREMVASYTRESGVRVLERKLAGICRKAAMHLVSEDVKQIRITEKELKDYLENGNIQNSVNLPNVAQEWSGISRVCLIHQNIPAMLTKITSILSKEGVNVENLTNKSKKDYAYTMVDLNSRIKDKVAEELRAIPGMIRVRVLNH